MPDPESPEYVFVYGTLRQDSPHPLATLLAREARPVGVGSLRGRLYDLGAYPGVVLDPEGEHLVHGEVLELRDGSTVLAMLDDYEGCSPPNPPPALFIRDRATIELSGGRRIEAWVYTCAHPCDESRFVPGGRWRG